jgi:SNF2 family DNA or RNA helicase
MHLLESRWIEDSGGIPAFLGARIQPMGHQLYAARRVLWDRVPRFILADEVGLGKTIEAGLVIQALRAEKPDLSVLIVAPGSMARQWQMELYLRFGAHACVHLDSATFAKVSTAARKRLLDSLSLVATTTVLQRFPETTTRLAQRHWDLVVVDEAHQFPPGCGLYDFFHRLARESPGFLALSATPSKREITSLAGLLALVAPDVYEPADEAGLSRRLAAQREVWDRLSFTRKYLDAIVAEGRSLQADDFEFLAEEWEGLLDSDPMAMALIDDLK